METSGLADVHDVISWLKEIEELVGSLYTQAAKACSKDKEFSRFLSRLAKDEQSHAQYMAAVIAHLPDIKAHAILDIALDPRTRERVETPLKRFKEHIAGKSMCKRCAIEYMARAESSELNPLFLYIVSKFSAISRESERMTSDIQSHLLRIQDFIDSLDRDLKPSVDVQALPAIWENRFLVVDDHEPLRRLVAALLTHRGNVEMAAGGKEGLKKIKEHFYNGIVSDIEMPGLNGFEFYDQAVGYDSKLKGNFLFYSADITPERELYLKQNRLSFLRKPFALSKFHENMDRILRQ